MSSDGSFIEEATVVMIYFPRNHVSESKNSKAMNNNFEAEFRLGNKRACDGISISEEMELISHKRPKTDTLSESVIDVAQLDSSKVQETLKIFRQMFISKKIEDPESPRVDMSVAYDMKKKGLWINTEKRFGHVPGVKVGDTFHLRAELMVVGLHCSHMSGIDYMDHEGTRYAISIVNSGRYYNESRDHNVLVYSGHGDEKEDQKLVLGNLAMVNSMKASYPIRVISRRTSNPSPSASPFSYDGLYIIARFWKEKSSTGKFIFRFQLNRLGQQIPSIKFMGKERCVVDDLSEGEENMPIRALNAYDTEPPPAFSYISTVAYPEWCTEIEHGGCGCKGGCSTSTPCPCIARKIDGELPVVFECGPNCKCPSSCGNRASQRGLCYRLEVFKTDSGEWGVRTKGFISSGSFVCEYVGKLQQLDKPEPAPSPDSTFQDAGMSSGSCNEQSTYRVDSSKFGNVSRFIRQSSRPNLVVRHVVYDKTIPHIMLFASKNIPPLHELTHPLSDIGRINLKEKGKGRK